MVRLSVRQFVSGIMLLSHVLSKAQGEVRRGGCTACSSHFVFGVRHSLWSVWFACFGRLEDFQRILFGVKERRYEIKRVGGCFVIIFLSMVIMVIILSCVIIDNRSGCCLFGGWWTATAHVQSDFDGSKDWEIRYTLAASYQPAAKRR
jgi:hypothetical protein